MKHLRLFESFKEANLNVDQIFYTGKNIELSNFTLDHLSRNNNDEHGPGIYLTNDQKDAKGYGNFIHVIKLKPIGEIIKRGDKVKPIDTALAKNMIRKFSTEWEMEAQNWHENPSRGLDEFIASTIKSAIDRIDFYEYVWSGFFLDEPKKFAEGMVANGIDAIILAGYNTLDGITHVVVYNTDIMDIQDVIKL